MPSLLNGYRRWSEDHGDPFPWLCIAIYSIPILLILFAITLGILW